MHGTQDDENRRTFYNTTRAGTQVPAFQFSVLTCVSRSRTATKTIYPDKDPKPYDNVKFWHFAYKEIDCLEDFAKVALEWLVTQPRCCIIRGQLKPGLTGMQRRLKLPKDGDLATLTCPQRRWIVLDCDKTEVPAGLGAGDKVAEAGYHIRDKLLPSYFRGVRCIAAASPSTGRKGPTTAHLRLYFVLKEAAENDALWQWVSDLSEKHLFIDPKVMEMQQPIYTARPIFSGCLDPVPEWGRVRILDGYDDELEFEMPRGWKPKERNGASWVPDKPQYEVPEELLEVTAQDAGLGVPPLPEEISDKAWKIIRKIFEALDGCPPAKVRLSNNKKIGLGRHDTLNAAAWCLARLVAECELSEAKAREAFQDAVKGINNSDGKYDAALIQRHIDDAFSDVCRNP